MPDPAAPSDPTPANTPDPKGNGSGDNPPADNPAGGGGGAPARPEGLADAFWDEKAGTVKVPELAASHSELASFKAAADSRAAQVPGKVDGYKLEAPADFEIPKDIEFAFKADDPRVKPLMEWAHRHGVTQSAFSELLAIDGKVSIDNFVSDREWKTAEMAKLGEKGPERVKAVSDWLDAQLPDKDQAATAKDLLILADGVKLFENIMQKLSGPTVVRSGGEATGAKPLSEMTLDEKMAIANAKMAKLAGVKTG